jgi:hypothetical protein
VHQGVSISYVRHGVLNTLSALRTTVTGMEKEKFKVCPLITLIIIILKLVSVS